MRKLQNVDLKKYTTAGVGGLAKLFYKAPTAEKLIEAVLLAKHQKLPYLILGEGSNVLISDEGFPGVVIKNEIRGIIGFKQIIKVGAGTLLSKLVTITIRQGLSGLQKLSGIPGTVGGAVYGNAGAYGTSISDYITRVIAFDPITEKTVSLTRKQCLFSYRDSIFKKGGFIILEVHFKLSKLPNQTLKMETRKILQQRAAKNYQEGKSPGSFFKNIPQEALPKKILKLIPQEKIIHGKIPAGFLLEQVGAKNMQIGKIKVSQNHANLLINLGDGTSADFYALALELMKKVKEKFGITLEPEVQLINLPPLHIASSYLYISCLPIL